MRLTRSTALAIALACGLLAALGAWVWIGSRTDAVPKEGNMPTSDVITIDGHQIVTEIDEGQTYDVVWLNPNGDVETFKGISKWCKMGGLCHGGALHFVDPKTNQWIRISGTYKCSRIDKVEK